MFRRAFRPAAASMHTRLDKPDDLIPTLDERARTQRSDFCHFRKLAGGERQRFRTDQTHLQCRPGYRSLLITITLISTPLTRQIPSCSLRGFPGISSLMKPRFVLRNNARSFDRQLVSWLYTNLIPANSSMDRHQQGYPRIHIVRIGAQLIRHHCGSISHDRLQ